MEGEAGRSASGSGGALRRSTTTMFRQPRFANMIAVAMPAGPPPTITLDAGPSAVRQSPGGRAPNSFHATSDPVCSTFRAVRVARRVLGVARRVPGVWNAETVDSRRSSIVATAR